MFGTAVLRSLGTVDVRERERELTLTDMLEMGGPMLLLYLLEVESPKVLGGFLINPAKNGC